MNMQPNRTGSSEPGKETKRNGKDGEYKINTTEIDGINIYKAENLMDEVLREGNMKKAAKKVIANKGCP